jgi:Raf kinase inhibitor-like YbhB/YbcL family protein
MRIDGGGKTWAAACYAGAGEEAGMRNAAIAILFAAWTTSAAAMTLTSQDLKDGAPMPAANIYARCGGQNISPQLSWSGAPAGTKSLAVTMIDLSVKPTGWSHWIVVGLPPSLTTMPRRAPTLPPGARQIATNFGDAAYGGPCPPPGTGVHRYEITVWALPGPAPAISPDAPATGVEAALRRAALDHASMTVTAGR